MTTEQTINDVKSYYGETLTSSDDLKTDACCTADAMPAYASALINNIHPEILDKFYGCGSPIPPLLKGLTVLDLGCGTGRDSYVISQLVGKTGRVIGVDMTEEQLNIAQKHQQTQAEKFGYSTPNTTFKMGYIEDLKTLGIEDESVDVVISNCVINLSANKEQVFQEIHRILKPGGELYFADIFSDRRIPTALQQDKVLLGECLGGALYVEDFRRLCQKIGFADYRLLSQSILAVNDEKIIDMVEDITFYSMTVRSFKCHFEDRCEDFAHQATYLGAIPDSHDSFTLDDHHILNANVAMKICGNTAKMLSETRFAPHFNVEGDFSQHKGLFECAPTNNVPQKIIGGCC